MTTTNPRDLPIRPAGSADLASFREWFSTSLSISAKLDYDAAAKHYAPDYEATAFWFGNLEPSLTHGFSETREKQWKLVWPRAKGLVVTHDFEMYVSDDRLWAVAAGTIKVDMGGATPVATRISYVLVRAAVDAPWNAVHAHHSADPGQQAHSARQPPK